MGLFSLWRFSSSAVAVPVPEPTPAAPLPTTRPVAPAPPAPIPASAQAQVQTDGGLQQQPYPSVLSQRSLKQLGFFFGGAGFLMLSVLASRRAAARHMKLAKLKFYQPTHGGLNGPLNGEPKKGERDPMVAFEALKLATLNVMSFGIMAVGGIAWAFDITNLEELRTKARKRMYGDGGKLDEEAEKEVVEWFAKFLVPGLKENEGQEQTEQVKKPIPHHMWRPRLLELWHITLPVSFSAAFAVDNWPRIPSFQAVPIKRVDAPVTTWFNPGVSPLPTRFQSLWEMDVFMIDVFRYQYRTPCGNNPCDFLESPQNINVRSLETGRFVQGSSSWASAADVVRDRKLFQGKAEVHGVIRTADWQNQVGDKVWIRTDMPLQHKRKSAPIVNLTQLRSSEVWIRDVNWRPHKREIKSGSRLLTLAGPEFPWHSTSMTAQQQRFRICIIVNKCHARAGAARDDQLLPPTPPSSSSGTPIPVSGFPVIGDDPPPGDQIACAAMAAFDRTNVLDIVTLDEMSGSLEDVVSIMSVAASGRQTDMFWRSHRSHQTNPQQQQRWRQRQNQDDDDDDDDEGIAGDLIVGSADSLVVSFSAVNIQCDQEKEEEEEEAEQG
ncbi:hypothetical protein B0H66DRAFT_528291 [Apodospora peruviana]|uniref:Altered inheritance of mitochondria protein 11 n=1 Tax=Apodospora peruviana TaxID=516989 RepID=A0AAE0MGL7_9PEZI|nr:hypothetical protein B0H66DRAFT_528291 [Apodospora peruviana]